MLDQVCQIDGDEWPLPGFQYPCEQVFPRGADIILVGPAVQLIKDPLFSWIDVEMIDSEPQAGNRIGNHLIQEQESFWIAHNQDMVMSKSCQGTFAADDYVYSACLCIEPKNPFSISGCLFEVNIRPGGHRCRPFFRFRNPRRLAGGKPK